MKRRFRHLTEQPGAWILLGNDRHQRKLFTPHSMAAGKARLERDRELRFPKWKARDRLIARARKREPLARLRAFEIF